jgi:hypothetical protein
MCACSRAFVVLHSCMIAVFSEYSTFTIHATFARIDPQRSRSPFSYALGL